MWSQNLKTHYQTGGTERLLENTRNLRFNQTEQNAANFEISDFILFRKSHVTSLGLPFKPFYFGEPSYNYNRVRLNRMGGCIFRTRSKMTPPTVFLISPRSEGVRWKTEYVVISTHPELFIFGGFRAQEMRFRTEKWLNVIRIWLSEHVIIYPNFYYRALKTSEMHSSGCVDILHTRFSI